jgi:glycosyltransferase involved in cell wall biosynthesis
VQNKTILIGMPTSSGVIPVETVQSLLMLHKPFPCAFMYVVRQRIDKARNAMVIEALKNEVDYLFFVDDDNPIPPNTLELFIEDNKDIVSAPIISRGQDRNGNFPMCAFYSKEVNLNGDSSKIKLYYPIVEFRDNGYLHKVDAVGCGCLLIKRKVLEVLFSKYKQYVFEFGDVKFDHEIEVDGKLYDRRTMAEDCEFSERAVNAGFEIWLDDRIRPLHISDHRMLQWSDK